MSKNFEMLVQDVTSETPDFWGKTPKEQRAILMKANEKYLYPEPVEEAPADQKLPQGGDQEQQEGEEDQEEDQDKEPDQNN